MSDKRLSQSLRTATAQGADPRERSAFGVINESDLGPGLKLENGQITLDIDPLSSFYTDERGKFSQRVGGGLVVAPGSPNTLKVAHGDTSLRIKDGALIARPHASQVVGLDAAIEIAVAVGAAPKGSAVSQSGSKSNPVTIDTRSGSITMFNSALASMTSVAFTVNYGDCSADDIPQIALARGGTVGAYLLSPGAVAKGSFQIVVFNCSGGPLSESLVLNYLVERGSGS